MNPAIGRYDVSVQAGPAFGTRRQEAVEAMKEIIAGNPQMMALIGDEFVKMMDIPGADKIAKRLATMLPPQVQQAESAEKEGQESAEVLQVKQQAQAALEQQGQQMQMLMQQMQETQTELQKCQQELADKSAERDTSLREEQIKAGASVQEAQIKAGADVEIARLQAMAAVNTPQPAPVQPAPPAPNVQVMPADSNDVAGAVAQLAQHIQEQNGHMFLAVSAIADELTKPKAEPPERSRIQGRMIRQADGSYTFDAVKNETA